MAWRWARGETISVERLRAQLRILPKFERFLQFFIGLLEAEGVLERNGGELRFISDGERLATAEEQAVQIEAAYPQTAALLGLIAYCADHYGAALSGEMAAIEVLYPEGELDLRGVEQEDDLVSSRMSCIKRLRETVQGWAGERPLRILEVGGGNGFLTRLLAEDLQGLAVTYTFTDISRALVLDREREAAAAGWSFMETAQLDIGRDPVEQGFRAGSFDVIVGLDVTHIPAEIEQTVRYLRQLLGSGGRLCLLESLNSWRWVDMIWGLADGWWSFTDEGVAADDAAADAAGVARGCGRVVSGHGRLSRGGRCGTGV